MAGPLTGSVGTATGARRSCGPRLVTVARRMQVDRVTGEVVSAMDAAGIPTILLKGPSIARWLYPDGGRFYADTDLLVRASDHAGAGDALRAIGFVDRFDGFHPVERRTHPVEETAFVRPGRPADRREDEVDLHRNLPGLPTPDERLWEVLDGETSTLPVGGRNVRVLNRAGVALHVVLHAVQHGFGLHTDEDLRRAIAAMPAADWGPVAALAGRLGVDNVLGLGLRHHPRGGEIADALGLPQLSIAGSPYQWAFLGGPRGAASLALLWEAPTWREKARLIRWQIVPSPARVRDVVRLPDRPPSLARGYIGWWRGLAEAALPAAGFALRQRYQSRAGRAETSEAGTPKAVGGAMRGTVSSRRSGVERRNDPLPQ